MWLERVHLERFHKAYPHELSGGMRQRVALARAFAVDADVLLMDEPFSGLDEFTARDMREQLLELWIQTGKTIVFVTHNSFEASFLSDRILAFSPRPGRVSYDMPIDIPRPRNYESAELFELSNQVARSLSKPL
jgi:NitT/TauT family transport system ATP-binding protein